MPFLAFFDLAFFGLGGWSPPVVHPVVHRSCTFSLVTKSLSSYGNFNGKEEHYTYVEESY